MNDRPTPMTLADEVGTMVHAFSDADRRERVRELARQVADLERQLAAKTEECEGWEKQWRQAAMNALTDKTRDELAEVKAQLREEQRLHVVTLDERDEAREQRDRLAEALEKTAKDFILFRDVARENGIVGTLGLESLYLAESALATLNQTTQ